MLKSRCSVGRSCKLRPAGLPCAVLHARQSGCWRPTMMAAPGQTQPYEEPIRRSALPQIVLQNSLW